jgi:acyl-CoA synthetase (AMP-forming)/AMP-acid ligase II
MDINWIIDSPFELLPEGDPDADALSIDGEPSLTYRQLRALRDKWVAEFVAAGVVAGDRVGLLLLNSHDYVAAYFAIARIGAIAVRLNFRLTAPELQYIIGDSGCKVVLFTPAEPRSWSRSSTMSPSSSGFRSKTTIPPPRGRRAVRLPAQLRALTSMGYHSPLEPTR